jgi:hypothetical protein
MIPYGKLAYLSGPRPDLEVSMGLVLNHDVVVVLKQLEPLFLNLFTVFFRLGLPTGTPC